VDRGQYKKGKINGGETGTVKCGGKGKRKGIKGRRV